MHSEHDGPGIQEFHQVAFSLYPSSLESSSQYPQALIPLSTIAISSTLKPSSRDPHALNRASGPPSLSGLKLHTPSELNCRQQQHHRSGAHIVAEYSKESQLT